MIRDPEDRKLNQDMRNKSVINIRFSAEELALLQNMMAKDGWSNTSGFIKSVLFNDNPDKRIKETIKRGEPSEIGNLLRNVSMDIANHFMYFHARYDKDMRQLYREEGTDLNKWIAKTNKWHSEMTKHLQKYLGLVADIADALGLDSYTDLPSTHMEIDPETATKEEMDALAEQLLRERIAMGGDPDVQR